MKPKELKLQPGTHVTGEVLSEALDLAARDWRTTGNKCRIVDQVGAVVATVVHSVRSEDVEVLSTREVERRYGRCRLHYYYGCIALENGIYIYSRPGESFHQREARVEAANLGFTVVMTEDLS